MENTKYKAEMWARDVRKQANAEFFSQQRKTRITGQLSAADLCLAKLSVLELREKGFLEELICSAVSPQSPEPARLQALRVLSKITCDNYFGAAAATLPEKLWRDFVTHALRVEHGPTVVTNLLLDDQTGVIERICAEEGRAVACVLRCVAEGKPAPDVQIGLQLASAFAAKPSFKSDAGVASALLGDLARLCDHPNSDVAQRAFEIGSFFLSASVTRQLFERHPRLLQRGLSYFNASREWSHAPDILVATSRMMASYLFAFDGCPKLIAHFAGLADLRQLPAHLNSQSSRVRRYGLWLTANVLSEAETLGELPDWVAVASAVFEALGRWAIEDKIPLHRKEATRCLLELFQAAHPAWLAGFAAASAPLLRELLNDAEESVVELALEVLRHAALRCPEAAVALRADPAVCSQLEQLQLSAGQRIAGLAAAAVEALFG